MSVRTAYVGLQSPGDILTSENFTRLPGGWIAFEEKTGSQVTTGTSELELHSISSVVINAARKVKITFSISHFVLTNAADIFQLDVRSGASGTVQRARTRVEDTTYTIGIPQGRTVTGVFNTTTGGTHVIKAVLYRVSGSGTCLAYRDANSPGYLIVEDIGPAEPA